MCVCSHTASAEEQEFISNGIKYRILDLTEKTVEVIENTKTVIVDDGDGFGEYEDEVSLYNGNITVPSKVNYDGVDYQVKRIGEFAFSYAEIDNIILSPGIESIESDAFEFSNIQEIDLGAIKCIESGVFNGCRQLKNVHLPSSLREIHTFSFSNSGLETISIDVKNPNFYIYDNALYSINEYGTKEFVFLPELSPQETLTLDPYCSGFHYAIFDNNNLKKLIVPGNPDELELHDCSSLEEIVFSGQQGSEMYTIGGIYVSGCDNLHKITPERELPPAFDHWGHFALSLDFSKIEVNVPDEYKSRYAICFPWLLSPSLSEYAPDEVHLVGTVNGFDFDDTSKALYRDDTANELIYKGDVVLTGDDEFIISGEVGSYSILYHNIPFDNKEYVIFNDFNYYEEVEYETIHDMIYASSSDGRNYIVNPKWPKMPVGITANFTTGKITFSTTTIASVDTVSEPDENETMKYYDIMGRPTTKDHKGIVIVVKNGKATKHIQN